ncbi:MAG: nucleotidyl transferase AbiEii/AbiGii toxin family protein [candidate division WOR-3 bacterium]
MEELKNFLKKLVSETSSKNRVFKRNILKEYFQILVLDFIYSSKDYSDLILYGGSCLSHCYGLPRLSEDLDFVDPKKKINLPKLKRDLENYFFKNFRLKIKTNLQKFRLYLKFPILKEIDLASKNESNFLFLKIEIFSDFDFCKKYKIEIIPLFKFNKTILVKTLDLPTLMATKIRAILHRKWEKTDKKGRTIAKVKGRDYFDLMWYLEKKVVPNFECLEEIKNIEELKEKLFEIIKKVDAKSIRVDLEPLIENKALVENLSKNLKKILENQVEKLIKN